MGISIVEADIEDAEEILALQKAAYASEGRLYEDFTLPPLTQTLEEMREDLGRQLFLKVVEDGEIIGSVRAHMKGDTCRVGRLIVRPDRQDRGIGSRLLKEIEERFPGAERFTLFTGHRSDKALHIYEKNGYGIYRTEPVHARLTLVYLEKRRNEG
ncbi:MAG: GNAT family N-acetyltransferase [Actinobacteria bacterium]|jgi:ribosomal protein S18 acetylase RimI-like enzyme|nr:MAG: GNAT family N-acetyltransferase [Actinomycetota bacterium]